MLVRMPANALIDFLLPTLEGGNWLDLANADAVAAEGASVWIADMLSIYENGSRAAKTPAARREALSDERPLVRDVQDALNRVKGAPLPVDTLVLQEQVTVDALLEAPITSMHSRFSFEPRFARLGVVVDTSLTFLTSGGTFDSFSIGTILKHLCWIPDRAIPSLVSSEPASFTTSAKPTTCS